MARHLVAPTLELALGHVQHHRGLARDKVGEFLLRGRVIHRVMGLEALLEISHGIGLAHHQVHAVRFTGEDFPPAPGGGLARVACNQVAQTAQGQRALFRGRPNHAQGRDKGVFRQCQRHHQLAAVEAGALVFQVYGNLRRLKRLIVRAGVVLYPVAQQLLFEAVARIEYEQDLLRVPLRPWAFFIVECFQFQSSSWMSGFRCCALVLPWGVPWQGLSCRSLFYANQLRFFYRRPLPCCG